jgi:Zn-dependent peptidase ImmA (M78 family)
MPDEWWAQVKAREVIKSLKINHPSDVSIENIAWTQGALVVENGLRGCDARLVYTKGVKPAILRVKKSLSPAGKRRFAIAHELGHLKLSHNPGQPTECAEKEFHSWYKDQRGQEVEANIFAAELLMPESLFAPRSQSSVPSFETIESLALDFQTTLTVTAIRYVQLCEQKCAVISSHGGRSVLVLAKSRISSLDKARQEVERKLLCNRLFRKRSCDAGNAGNAGCSRRLLDRRRV